MRVRLIKQRRPAMEYDGEVLSDDGSHLILRAPFPFPPIDIGPVRFETGELWVEHYWRDRWYSVKEVFDLSGRRKGWYCDIARPAVVEADSVTSEDLELDLWVSTDRRVIVRLDEDEADMTPPVVAAVEELERMAMAGEPPFTPARQQRTVFGEDAELYDRRRPAYPTALIDAVVALVDTPARAIDVGCGTGKATELLAARGVTGVAVDPDACMAALAAARLAGYPAGVSTSRTSSVGGRPTAIFRSTWWSPRGPGTGLTQPYVSPRASPSSGQAAGWPSSGTAPAADTSPLRQALDSVYAELAPEVPTDGPGSTARRGPKELAEGGELAHAARRTYPWSHRYTSAEWTDLLRTQSDHRLLPPTRLEGLLQAVAAAIDGTAGSTSTPT